MSEIAETVTIEQVYTGGARMSFQEEEYIVCLIHGAERVVKDFCCGDISKREHGIKRIRLPVIRVGETPNDDGFYRLKELTCVFEDEKIKVVRVRSFDNKEQQYFYDIMAEEILVTGNHEAMRSFRDNNLEKIGKKRIKNTSVFFVR